MAPRRVAILGATGAVGREVLRLLEERSFPADEVLLAASGRWPGRRLRFRDQELPVAAVDACALDGADLVVSTLPAEVAREVIPRVLAPDRRVVDCSSAFRLDPDVPLVVPEVNGDTLHDTPRGLVASPNCSTTQLVVALAPLHRRAGLRRLVVATYQAVSGAGRDGMVALQAEQEARAAGLSPPPATVFPGPIAGNLLPQCGTFDAEGYTQEENKLLHESRKILAVPDLQVTATCVRVPVLRAHSEAVHATFHRPLAVAEARELLREAPGVRVVDDPLAPVAQERFATPLDAAGHGDVRVGRIRQDRGDPRSLVLWVVADQLLKGAALNAVQIAECWRPRQPEGG